MANEINIPVNRNNLLTGVDSALEKLAISLASLPWLEKSWARAKQANSKLEPMIYLNAKEYYSVMPNDSYKSYSFWFVQSEQRALDSSTTMTSVPMEAIVSCICWVDLRRLNVAKDFIFVQELIKDIVNLTNRNGNFTLLRIYDEKVEDIFKGFPLKEQHRDLLMFPYQSFRIEGRLSYDFKYC